MKQEQGVQGLMKRKRRQPARIAMDFEQTMIPVHLYQSWLQNASDIVSRGRKRKVHYLILTCHLSIFISKFYL